MIQSTHAERYPKVSYMHPEGTMEYYSDQTRPEPNTVNSGNFVSFKTLIGCFLKKSFRYGRPFFFSVDVQNRGLGSGTL